MTPASPAVQPEPRQEQPRYSEAEQRRRWLAILDAIAADPAFARVRTEREQQDAR